MTRRLGLHDGGDRLRDARGVSSGRTIAAVAAEIGVGQQLLGRWVAIERSWMDDPPEAVDADERAELERLRREVAELRLAATALWPPW